MSLAAPATVVTREARVYQALPVSAARKARKVYLACLDLEVAMAPLASRASQATRVIAVLTAYLARLDKWA